MLRLMCSLAAAAVAVSSIAQSFNGTESVEWDPVNNGWLVANPVSGQLIATDPQGNILSVFATPGSPYGTDVLHDTVYSCDNGGIKGYNLHDGTQVMNLNLNGTFLNGLTSDGDRFLFATDFSTDRIFRIDVQNQTFNVLRDTDVRPNGIVYDGDNNRLVYVEWSFNAEIRAVSLADSTESNLVNTSFGNIDGITMDDNGNFFVTPWSPSSLQMFNNDFSLGPTQVLSGLSSPADIDFSVTTDSVAIPNSGNNTLSFYHSPDTMVNTSVDAMARPEPTMMVYPMPADAFTVVALRNPATSNTTLTLVDANGKVERTIRIAAGTQQLELSLSKVVAGSYWLRLQNAAGKLDAHQLIVRH